MGFRNLTAQNREWSYISANGTPGTKIVDVASTQHIEIYYCKVTCANSNTGDTSCRIGVGTSGLATRVDDSATGMAGLVLSHGGIPKGGGVVETMGGAPILVGAADQDVYLENSAPTGGSLRVTLQYRIVDDPQ